MSEQSKPEIVTAPFFDLPAIRSRALADPWNPAGRCLWHGGQIGNDGSCGPTGEGPCEGDFAIACADRTALVGEVDRLTGERDAAVAELAQLRANIEAYVKRVRGAICGATTGDADEAQKIKDAVEQERVRICATLRAQAERCEDAGDFVLGMIEDAGGMIDE